MTKVDLRVVTMDIPSQDIISKDNVTLKVNGVVYFRVSTPDKSVIAVENFFHATSQIAQTTLRSVIGRFELDEILSCREEINGELQKIIDEQTEPWGIKVSAVEVKAIDLPPEMQRPWQSKQRQKERKEQKSFPLKVSLMLPKSYRKRRRFLTKISTPLLFVIWIRCERFQRVIINQRPSSLFRLSFSAFFLKRLNKLGAFCPHFFLNLL